jgi:hypothetical protein
MIKMLTVWKPDPLDLIFKSKSQQVQQKTKRQGTSGKRDSSILQFRKGFMVNKALLVGINKYILKLTELDTKRAREIS